MTVARGDAPIGWRGRLAPWWPVWLLAAAIGAITGVLALGHGFVDLDVYRWGGERVREGLPLYEGGAPDTGLPFTYPPLAALLFAPVSMLPKWLAVALWSGASVLALALVIDVVLQFSAGPGPGIGLIGRLGRLGWLGWHRRVHLVWWVLGALCCYPVYLTLAFGQVNLFLMALIVWDVLVARGRWAGWLVGLAAGLKLTPLIFVGFLVLLGRRAVAARAVCGFAATVLIGWVALPSASAAFWGGVGFDAARTGGLMYASNQSLRAVWIRLLGVEPNTALWAGSVLVALALCCGAGVLAWRQGLPALGLTLAAFGGLLASPVSWAHHWVWVVPLVVALVVAGWARAASLIAIPFVLATIMWPPNRHKLELEWSWWQQVLGNLWATAALCCAVWVLVTLRPRSGGDSAQLRAGEMVPVTSPSVSRDPSAAGAE